MLDDLDQPPSIAESHITSLKLLQCHRLLQAETLYMEIIERTYVKALKDYSNTTRDR